MGGIVQSVDVSAHIFNERGFDPVQEGLNVVEAEIERVFAGGGSTAEVKVIFDSILDHEQEHRLQALVDEGARDDHFYGMGFEEQRDRELNLTVDVTVTNMGSGSVRTIKDRLFTGTVIKVEQNSERVVTFTALDRRHQLNRNMVKLDTSRQGTSSDQILDHLLGEELGLERGTEYVVSLTGETERISETWGVGGSHATMFEVLQDVTRKEGVPLHIDKHNRIVITRWPQHVRYESDTMSPIVAWESGDEETSNDVVVSSPYDETGLGVYAPISSQADISEYPGGEDVGQSIEENNVFSRKALENVRTWEWVENELMKDSGVIHTLGDPRIEPYDEFVLDDDAIDAFAPIAEGTYTSKTVRHLIGGQDGYITEIELGKDPQELFEKFTTTRSREEQAEAQAQEADPDLWDAVKTTGDVIF